MRRSKRTKREGQAMHRLQRRMKERTHTSKKTYKRRGKHGNSPEWED